MIIYRCKIHLELFSQSYEICLCSVSFLKCYFSKIEGQWIEQNLTQISAILFPVLVFLLPNYIYIEHISVHNFHNFHT